MPTTLETLETYLQKRGWRYGKDPDYNRIITGVAATHVERFIIVLQLSDNGNYLQLQAPLLLQVKEAIHKERLLQTLLHIQYQVKLLRLGYDPEDGEICAAIALPLEDTSLTEQQFNRCLRELIVLVDQVVVPRLKVVLATGADPGMPSLANNRGVLLI